jgi:tryptophan synthase alpha chain
MSRYQKLFATLTAEKRGAFVPFVPVGDPTPELSFKIIQTLIESGADALELGIPFSDPMADGPTIQNANIRAFKAGITVEKCFEILTNVRAQYTNIPIGLLIYANLVFKNGIDEFYAKCAKAGVDSVLIADLPAQYAQEFTVAAEKYNIAPIFICPPNADDKVIQSIAKQGKGYTYLVSRAGVTGAENRANKPLTHLIKKLIEFGAPPALQGFGISEPTQVSEAIKSGVVGAISGSATVKIIEKNLDNPEQMLSQLAKFVQSMKQATSK